MNKVIPQVDFDRAVQKIMSCGLARKPAENITLGLWQASLDLSVDFKQLIDKSTASGNLDVDQVILNHINKSLPGTLRYNKKETTSAVPIVNRELRYNEYFYTTEAGEFLGSEDDKLLASE